MLTIYYLQAVTTPFNSTNPHQLDVFAAGEKAAIKTAFLFRFCLLFMVAN